MGTSLFLAKFLGIYLVVAGIGIFKNTENVQKLAREYGQSPALIYLGGIFALIFGLLIVLFHNIWAPSWIVTITLIGWLGLIKGIWLLVFPGSVAKFVERYQGSTTPIKVQAVIAFVLGLFLLIKSCGCFQ